MKAGVSGIRLGTPTSFPDSLNAIVAVPAVVAVLQLGSSSAE